MPVCAMPENSRGLGAAPPGVPAKKECRYFVSVATKTVDLFEQDLSSSPERELAGRFRAASDDPLPVFPDSVAAFNEACQQEDVPQNGTRKRKEPAEWMPPFAVSCHEAQQQVRQQCSPDLPAHGVLVMAEEIRQLEGLLDLLEEHLHTPAALVKLADGEGRPFKVVCNGCRLHHLPLDFNFGCHQSQFFWIMFPGVESSQPDTLIEQDAAFLPDIYAPS